MGLPNTPAPRIQYADEGEQPIPEEEGAEAMAAGENFGPVMGDNRFGDGLKNNYFVGGVETSIPGVMVNSHFENNFGGGMEGSSGPARVGSGVGQGTNQFGGPSMGREGGARVRTASTRSSGLMEFSEGFRIAVDY